MRTDSDAETGECQLSHASGPRPWAPTMRASSPSPLWEGSVLTHSSDHDEMPRQDAFMKKRLIWLWRVKAVALGYGEDPWWLCHTEREQCRESHLCPVGTWTEDKPVPWP